MWISFFTQYTVWLSGMLCHASNLLWLPSVWAASMERKWIGCKESVWTLGATHETLSSYWFSLLTSTTSSVCSGGVQHTQLSHARESRESNYVQGSLVFSTLQNTIYYFRVSHHHWGRVSNPSIFLLCLSGVFWESDYAIKKKSFPGVVISIGGKLLQNLTSWKQQGVI